MNIRSYLNIQNQIDFVILQIRFIISQNHGNRYFCGITNSIFDTTEIEFITTQNENEFVMSQNKIYCT